MSTVTAAAQPAFYSGHHQETARHNPAGWPGGTRRAARRRRPRPREQHQDGDQRGRERPELEADEGQYPDAHPATAGDVTTAALHLLLGAGGFGGVSERRGTGRERTGGGPAPRERVARTAHSRLATCRGLHDRRRREIPRATGARRRSACRMERLVTGVDDRTAGVASKSLARDRAARFFGLTERPRRGGHRVDRGDIGFDRALGTSGPDGTHRGDERLVVVEVVDRANRRRCR